MHKKLNIGLLFKENQILSDGYIKLIHDLIKSNRYEIKFIFKVEDNKFNNFFTHLFLKIIFFFEKKYLKIKRLNEIIIIKKYLSKLKNFNNLFEYNNTPDFSKSLKKIKNLDLIISFNKNILKKKYNDLLYNNEIWVVDYGCNDNTYIGFWNCYLNHNVTPVYLNKIFKKKNYSKIINIDKGFYSTKQSSWLLNRDFIIEKTNTLILKNLGLFGTKNKKKNNKFFIKDSPNPNYFILFNYILRKYPRVFVRKISSLLFRVLKLNLFYNSNLNSWNLHIGSYEDEKKINLSKSRRIVAHKGEEWADPFLVTYKDKDYLFFENFEFKTNKAKISYTVLENQNITRVHDVLNLKNHLSYPFVWCEKDNLYLMPESAKLKCIQIWKADKYLKKWKIYKTLLKGKSCADTTFFDDKKGNRWLFINQSNDKYDDHNSELYIYKTDKKFNKIVPHHLNPVITDSRFARSGGNIFYNKEGLLLRPSQKNIKNFYGKSLNLRIIKKLTLKVYEEVDYVSLNADFKKNINGIHHFSKNNKIYAVDLKYKNLMYDFLS